MFGVGAGEMVIIFFVLLLAVGPDKMPTLIKSVGKGVKEFRRTTRELRNQVGLDDLIGEERAELTRLSKEVSAPLKDFQRDLGTLTHPTPSVAGGHAATSGAKYMTKTQLQAEQPADAVDVDFVRSQVAGAAEGAAPEDSLPEVTGA